MRLSTHEGCKNGHIFGIVRFELTKPDILVVDNGLELRGRALDRWADDKGVQLYFIDPGKPTLNAYIESFNGRFREEGLNLHWFTSIGEAREIIEDWWADYNTQRPHSSLKYQTPEEFAAARLLGFEQIERHCVRHQSFWNQWRP